MYIIFFQHWASFFGPVVLRYCLLLCCVTHFLRQPLTTTAGICGVKASASGAKGGGVKRSDKMSDAVCCTTAESKEIRGEGAEMANYSDGVEIREPVSDVESGGEGPVWTFDYKRTEIFTARSKIVPFSFAFKRH
jgi:hypothetical protein